MKNLQSIWKESGHDLIEVLSHHFLGWFEENRKQPQPGKSDFSADI